MVHERSPRFMVGWKCQGASRCVPLWVESCTCSTAQPCPSGRSSAFSPSKNCNIRGNPCWWSMYWMVGWPPGGSAGTSFCRGTEMSINLRAMAFSSLCFCWGLSRLRVLPFNPVPQDTDFFDFKFDAVAMFEVPAELQSAAIADGARADELARHQ